MGGSTVMKLFMTGFLVLWSLVAAGCGAAVVGGGATGAYKVATDERTAGRLWDDSAISSSVKTALVKDPVVKARKIDVDVYEGEVILTGVVANSNEAGRAVEIAAKVDGVRSVKNNLQIGSKTIGQSIDDKLILSKIKTKLIAEPGIRSLNIDVDVNNGVVTLSGIVYYDFQKNKAIDIARTVAGVKKVKSYLIVKQS